MAQNNFGKSFLDIFSSTLAQDQPQSSVPQPAKLSNKMGVNKKKTTALQQNIINVIQQPQQAGMMQQGA